VYHLLYRSLAVAFQVQVILGSTFEEKQGIESDSEKKRQTNNGLIIDNLELVHI
jgi:hypothetical protein